MQHSRRQFLLSSAALGVCGLLPKVTVAQNKGTRVILLGTKGGPEPGFTRSNSSTLLMINNEAYVVDCGYGVTRQMIRADIAPPAVRYIFITHHHSDHNLEYGPLIYNAWSYLPTTRTLKIDAYGPAGLEKMTQDFFSYEKFDIETRMVDEGRSDPRKGVNAHDLPGEGLVMRNDNVTVRSLRVKHPPITDSYAYRFDAKDRSIVISGDTAYFPPLAEFAKGADVLIHEAMYRPAIDKRAAANPGPEFSKVIEHLRASHTNTEDVGKIAAQAGVKTLVLSHLLPGENPTITDDMWIEGARKHFSGKIVVAKDLMEI